MADDFTVTKGKQPVPALELAPGPSRFWPRLHMMGVSAGCFALLLLGVDLPWPAVLALCGLVGWSLSLHVAGRTLDLKALLDVAKEGLRR